MNNVKRKVKGIIRGQRMFLKGSKILFFLLALPMVGSGQSQVSTWQDFSFGTPVMTVHLPGAPQPKETLIEPSLLQVIQSYLAYGYENIPAGISVMLYHISYAEGIRPDLDIVGDQAIRELEASGALQVKYKTSTIHIGGKQGIRQSGTLEDNGNHMQFTSTIVSEDNKVWKVIIYMKSGDPKGNEIMKTILDSISFKEKLDK